MRLTVKTVMATAGLALLATSPPAGDGGAKPTDHAGAGGRGAQIAVSGEDQFGSERMTVRPLPEPPVVPPPPAGLAAAERAKTLLAAYQSAVAAARPECHLAPSLLAAIAQVESGSAGGRTIGKDHRVNPPVYGELLDGGLLAAVPDTDGGAFDGSADWDRSMGLMQVLPATWWETGADGDDDGLADPQNVYDSSHTVAGLLCRDGRDLAQAEDLSASVFAFKGSADYVAAVLAWVQYFRDRGLGSVGDVAFLVPSGGRGSDLRSALVAAAITGKSSVREALVSVSSPDSPSTGVPAVFRTTSSGVPTGPFPGGLPTTPPGPGPTTLPTPTTTPSVAVTTPMQAVTTPSDPPTTPTDPPTTPSDPPTTPSDPPTTPSDPPTTPTDPATTPSDPGATTPSDPATTTP